MKKLLFAVAFVGFALSAQAQIVFTFGNLNGGGQAAMDLDGDTSGTTSSGGVTLSATANTGTFNSTLTEGFGINGAGTDNTTEFDLDNIMSFSFDRAVTLSGMDFNAFNEASDEGYLTYSGGTIALTSDPFTFSGVELAANEILTLGVTSGSFSLQSIILVPEPSTYAMIGLGAAFLVGVQRFRRKV